ncbi:hypothetical protein BJX64DRAFT_292151 [Aspergillus heterothallicus]
MDTSIKHAFTGLEATASKMTLGSPYPGLSAKCPNPKPVLDPTKFWKPYSTRSVHTLPTELLLQIISHLPDVDIASLAGVTQRLYTILNPVAYEKLFCYFPDALKWVFGHDQTMIVRHFAQAAVRWGAISPPTLCIEQINQKHLSWANMKAHELIVDILLTNDDLYRAHASEKHQTPLSYAAATGNLRQVENLLSDGVNINSIDPVGNYGRTPLISALCSPLSEPSTDFLSPTSWT